MAIDVYRIGLVMNLRGLNKAQLTELQERLKFTARSLGKDYVIHLHVASFRGAPVFQTWPDDLKLLGHSTRIEVVPAHCQKPDALLRELRDCDEVWCCPSANETKKGRGKVARIYVLAQQNDKVGNHFIWIPTWVGDMTPTGTI